MTVIQKRCPWVGDEEIYLNYHDYEWGRPSFDDIHLFETLMLEMMQSGLSWLTILKKRENFRRSFADFQPSIIAKYDAAKFEQLMLDASIVRNRRKIQAVIVNAQAYLSLKESAGSLTEFLWSFVQNKPIVNNWQNLADFPSQTAISEQVAAALKKQGFVGLGPRTVYAFMQAVGMVIDHSTDCYLHGQILER